MLVPIAQVLGLGTRSEQVLSRRGLLIRVFSGRVPERAGEL